MLSMSFRSFCDRPLLRQPGVRALVLLVTLVSLYALYGSYHFYRDPLSIFFSETHGFDQFYSATRQAQADAFIDAAAAHADTDSVRARLGKAGPAPEICAVFITIDRNMAGRRHYVESAVGSFLANMSRPERAATHLKIFFADVPDAAQHRAYANLVASDLADDILTYGGSLPGDAKEKEGKIGTLKGWAAQSTNKWALERKTVHDYAYALQSCLRTTQAPYIALLEGDILLAEGWAARALLNLRRVEVMMREPSRRPPEPHKVQPGYPNTWLYLRLFNQERSTGWTGGTGFRSNNAHLISLAVAIPLLLILLLVRRPSSILPRALARHLDNWTLAVICGVAVPLFVWLFYASGKASLLPARAGVVRDEFFGCCNQALVYNRAHASALADYLFAATTRQPRCGRSDMLPRDFAWDRGLARMSAYPMLAQHAGRVSAIDTSDDEARRVWSMAFEDLRPELLGRQHVQDVRELWGEEAVRGMREEELGDGG
ncbi:hypothetical protein F4778DRAFT_743742 [Xylariomycetidae sp. FL2044]|nr:hypothetical protein F4778DRAFT_743742 [Xylariomycetidae sp. FL2044]